MVGETMEDLESFRVRAKEWMEANLPSLDGPRMDDHELQRLLFDQGWAGIAFPKEYGGAGLTLEHQKVFFDTARELGRQVPVGQFVTVSIGMLGPTLLDNASHEAKLRFLPALLRGDQVWMQLLSEPRGGSDMAGATTRLTRDGDTYVLNGAKMWSSGAYECDYGLCLARTDWDAPKHRGLSMIAVPLQGTPGVHIERTRAVNGEAGEFCQEFFDDVVLPAENLIGEENKGWAVAQSLLFHERNSVGNIGYGYLGGTGSRSRMARNTVGIEVLVDRMRARGEEGGRAYVTKVADAYVDQVVNGLTSARVMTGMRTGAFKGQWGSLLKLQGSLATHQKSRTSLAISGSDGVAWEGEDVRIDNPGTQWLGVRGGTLAGGSSEMQRNIVSERLIGLPREPAPEKDMPFNEVLKLIQRSGS
jgi:alkylation response protein AidB-like acyl-CoA dehydrogenase